MKNSLGGGAINKLLSTLLCVCLLTSIISFNNNYSYEVKADEGSYTKIDITANGSNTKDYTNGFTSDSNSQKISSNSALFSSSFASGFSGVTYNNNRSDHKYLSVTKNAETKLELSSDDQKKYTKIYILATSGGFSNVNNPLVMTVTFNYENSYSSSKDINFYDWNTLPTSCVGNRNNANCGFTSGVEGINVKITANKTLVRIGNESNDDKWAFEYEIPLDNSKKLTSISFKVKNNGGSGDSFESAIFAITGYVNESAPSNIKAYVGNVGYTSITDALKAINTSGYSGDKTIKLNADITGDSGTGDSDGININASGVTIDTNGYDINVEVKVSTSDVTIKDTNTTKQGTISKVTVQSGASNLSVGEGVKVTTIDTTNNTSAITIGEGTYTYDPSSYIKDNATYKVTKTSDNKYKVEKRTTITIPLSDEDKGINGTSLSNDELLKQALASDSITSVKLSSDVEITETVSVTGTKSLDLNGKKLAVNISSNTTKAGIEVSSGGTLTIDDNSTEGTGSIESSNNTLVDVKSDGTVNINKGSIKLNDSDSSNTTSAIKTSGTLNINGGEVSSTNGTALDIDGGTTKITSGNISSTSGTGIDISNGTLNINGGTTTGSTGINASGNGNINISDGNIKSTGENNADIVISESSNTTVSITGGNFGHGFGNDDSSTNKSSWLSTSDSTTYSAISSGNSEYQYVVVNATTINSSVNEYTSTDENSNHKTVTGGDYETLKTLVEQYEAINKDNSNKDSDYDTKLQTLKDKRDAAKWIFESLSDINTSTDNISPLTNEQKTKVKEAIAAYKGELTGDNASNNLTESQRKYISSDTLSSETSTSDSNATVTLTGGVLKDMNDAITFEDTYSDALKTGDDSKVSFTIVENGTVIITPSNLSEAKKAYEGLSDNAKKYADGGSGSSSSDNDGNTSTTITGSEDYTIITDKLAVADFFNTKTSSSSGSDTGESFASLLNKAKNTDNISSKDIDSFKELIDAYDKLVKTDEGDTNNKSSYISDEIKEIIENARKAVNFVEEYAKAKDEGSSTEAGILVDTNSNTKTTVENTSEYKTKLDNANSAYNNAVNGTSGGDGQSSENTLAKKLLEDYKKNLDNKNAAYNWYNPSNDSTDGDNSKDYKDIFDSTKTTVTADDLDKINAAVDAYKSLDEDVKKLIDSNVITKTSSGDSETDTYTGSLIDKQKAASYLNDLNTNLSSYITKDESGNTTKITTKSGTTDKTASAYYEELIKKIDDATSSYNSLTENQQSYIDGGKKGDDESSKTSTTLSSLANQKEAAEFLKEYAEVLTKDASKLTKDDLTKLNEAKAKFDGGEGVTGELSTEAKALLDETVTSRLDSNGSVAKANEWISKYSTAKTGDDKDDYSTNILNKTPITDKDLETINNAISAYEALNSSDDKSSTSYEQALVGGQATIDKLKEMKAVATWYSENKTIIEKNTTLNTSGDDVSNNDIGAVNKATARPYTITEKDESDNQIGATTLTDETISKYISKDVLDDLSNKKSATDYISKYKDNYLSEEGMSITDGNSTSNNKEAIKKAIEEYKDLNKEAKKYADGTTTDSNGDISESSYLNKLEDKLDAATFLEDYKDLLDKDSNSDEYKKAIKDLYEELNSTITDDNGNNTSKYSDNVKKYVAESILEKNKADAIDALIKKADETKTKIDNIDNLTDDDKSALKAKLTKTNNSDESSMSDLDKAIKAINDIKLSDKSNDKDYSDVLEELLASDDYKEKTSDSFIDGDDTTNNNKSVLSEAKETADKNLEEAKTSAKDTLTSAAEIEKSSIDNNSSLTDEQKQAYKKYVDYKLDEAKRAIDNSKLVSDVNDSSKQETLKNTLTGSTDSSSDNYVSPDKLEAINELVDSKKAKEEVISGMNAYKDENGSINDEGNKHKNDIDDTIAEAIEEIRKAQSDDGADNSSALEEIKNKANSDLDSKVDEARKEARNNTSANNGVVSNVTETKAANNFNNANIKETSSNDLENKILEESDKQEVDKGNNVSVWVSVEKIEESDSKVNDEIKERINTIKTGISSTQTIGNQATFLDINLYKQVDSGTQQQVSTTTSEITITLELPDDYKNTDSSYNRTYLAVRSHTNDGETTPEITTIPCTYNSVDNTVSFTTDKFSTYALIYVDTKIEDNSSSSSSNTSYKRTEANTPCEEWNKSRNWTWSSKLGKCVYRVRNTGSK